MKNIVFHIVVPQTDRFAALRKPEQLKNITSLSAR